MVIIIIVKGGVKGSRRLPVKEPDFSPDLLDRVIANFANCEKIVRGIYLQTTSILNRLILQIAQPYCATPLS